MDNWDQFIAGMDGLTEAEFLKIHTHPFLIIDMFAEIGGDEEDETVQVFDSRVTGTSLVGPPIAVVALIPSGQTDDPALTFGRTGDSFTQFNHPKISKMHARFNKQDDGTWTIMDLGSANGTRVEGDPIPPHVPMPLESGNSVSMGGTLYARFFLPENMIEAVEKIKKVAPAQESLDVVPSWDITAFLRLCFLMPKESFLSRFDKPFLIQRKAFKRELIPLSQTNALIKAEIDDSDSSHPRLQDLNLFVYYLCRDSLTIGREDTHLKIPSTEVSRSHGMMKNITPHGAVLVDEGSTNGTFINGNKVPAQKENQVKDQDRIKFGPVSYLFLEAGSAYDKVRGIGAKVTEDETWGSENLSID